mmetsp:Transcript_23675/g.59069  ORF Transcript_23675/g.59069 Transcript_23675/m.59069 type:complete len:265 (-) Transcript_23675:1116-1910(-)
MSLCALGISLPSELHWNSSSPMRAWICSTLTRAASTAPDWLACLPVKASRAVCMPSTRSVTAVCWAANVDLSCSTLECAFLTSASAPAPTSQAATRSSNWSSLAPAVARPSAWRSVTWPSSSSSRAKRSAREVWAASRAFTSLANCTWTLFTPCSALPCCSADSSSPASMASRRSTRAASCASRLPRRSPVRPWCAFLRSLMAGPWASHSTIRLPRDSRAACTEAALSPCVDTAPSNRACSCSKPSTKCSCCSSRSCTACATRL